ncbi:hypothetical protein [Microcoleus anatoxicus]
MLYKYHPAHTLTKINSDRLSSIARHSKYQTLRSLYGVRSLE